jgi:predicted phosphodiesterase
MFIGVIGDLHQNELAGRHAIRYMAQNGVQRIVQVGDFGVFPRVDSTWQFLEGLQEELEDAGIDLFVVRGNHDDPNYFADVIDDQVDDFGFGIDDGYNRIRFAPRAHTWEWAGKKFGQIGGAASIDRYRRTKDYDWWPDEIITDSDVNKIISDLNGERLDFLFSHDASDHTPWGFDLVPHDLSLDCRKKMDRVLDATTPIMHFHGHYHLKYEWTREYWQSDNRTTVYGLDCDGTWYYYGILDTDKEFFQWRQW